MGFATWRWQGQPDGPERAVSPAAARTLLACLSQLWPTFSVHHGCTLVSVGSMTGEFESGSYIKSDAAVVQDWIQACKGDLTWAEKMMNHVHLPDLLSLSQGADGLSRQEWTMIAVTYMAVLDFELARQFPGVEYRVQMDGDPLTDPLETVEITVFQVRAPSP